MPGLTFGLDPNLSASRLLVKPRSNAERAALATFHRKNSVSVLRSYPAMGNLEVIQLPPGRKASAAIDAYQRSGLVAYAEPDYVLHGLLTPQDSLFVAQWNLFNWGQEGGTAGADISALAAWDIQYLAENIVVAVVDSGIRASHQDLAPNLWINPGEIAGNGIDDDHNGYVDDIVGINAINGTGNPVDEHGHGSHVAGIIGARGSNQVGIAGVAWRVKLMSCKFLNAQLDGALSDAIEGIDYARKNGARIINASFGMPSYQTQALYDAINSARGAGILFVAACGNSSNNNDTNYTIYPASYSLDNIISVAATTSHDTLASFSSYGPTTVDLGAPGDTVLSCWYSADDEYNNRSGTSMAAPHVAGACALLCARFPNENYQQIKARVLAGTDPLPALAGRCVTGGRLNLLKALQSPVTRLEALGMANRQFRLRLTGQPNTFFVMQWSTNLVHWMTFATNQTSAEGMLNITQATGALNRGFYRAFVAP
jgi:subtilisin family serine protease